MLRQGMRRDGAGREEAGDWVLYRRAGLVRTERWTEWDRAGQGRGWRNNGAACHPICKAAARRLLLLVL